MLVRTIGWPQRGGAMPTTYGEAPADSNKAIDSRDEMYVNEDDDQRRDSAMDVAGKYVHRLAQRDYSDNDYGDDSQYDDDQDQSDNDAPAVTIGVVDGGSGNEVEYPEQQSSYGWVLPFTWFMRGSKDEPAATTPAADQKIVKTPEVERIDRLLKIRRKEKALEEEKENLMDRLYDDATNGRLSTQDGSQAAEAFSAGFLQGAVEASKRSVKAQGEFAEQLKKQSEIVDELEKVSLSLSSAQQKKDFEATAASVASKKDDKDEGAKKEKEETKDNGKDKEDKSPKKIQIDFYMEAECPGCKAFTTSVLTDVLNAVGDYVNLRAIPFGNAQLNNSVIQCQHGEDECIGNKIELCMMDKYGKNNDWQVISGSTSLSSRPRRKISFCYPNDPLSRLLAH
eukprot:751868-Hanusia_phi.AAC.2